MNKKSVEKVFRAIFILVFIMATGWVPHKSAMAQSPCPSSMVSYWTFNDGNGQTANDEIDGNPLTLGTSSEVNSEDPAWSTGGIGGALAFDGVNDLARGGSLPQMSEGTIEAWINRTAYGNYPNPMVFGLFRPGTYLGAIFILQADSNLFGTKIFEWVKMDSNNKQIRLATSDNAWEYNHSYHIVATWGSSGMKFYINGVLSDSTIYDGEVETDNPTTDFIGSTAPIEIGDYIAYGRAGWQPFAGTIDEVAVYNTALTQTEIQQHYQNLLNSQPYCETGLQNQPPIANAGGPYTAIVNQPIMLDASASSDPNGDTLAYWWDLDNDGVYDDLGGPTPFTTFNQTGEFIIGLQVSDVFGTTSTDTATVTVTSPVSNNSLFVAPLPNGLHAWNWPDGAWVTLTVDDPHTSQSPDYTETKQASYSAPWAPQNTLVEFVNGAYDIKAGDVITVTDGTTTKTHITTSLTVDQFDVNADTIAGTAEPGSTITVVRVCDDSSCSERTVTTDQSGHWVADFGNPGDTNHPETINIRPGTDGIAYQYDDDGDATQINWRVPNPRIFVVDSHYSNCCAYNVVGGEEWEPGKTISLSIDDPSNGAGWDYQDSLIALDGQYGWANSQWTFNVDPLEFPIQPGYLVQVTDGTTIKEHVVKDLVIIDVDLDADTVEGQSNSDEQIYVPVMVNDQYVERFVSPDVNGHWIADFGHPGERGNEQVIIDLTPDTMAIPEQADEDGDSTKLWWQLPNPYFFVDFAGDHVYAFQWPVGAMVTVTIDDPATPDMDYSGTQPVRMDNPWSSETWIDFQSPIPFKTGLIITMTDGTTIKTHTVTGLTVTEANSEADTVSGTAIPGALVRVWIHDPVCCIMRHVIANEEGRWEADYSVPGDEDFENETFDLQPGNNGQASQPDEDSDATNKPWQTPKPSITVFPDDEVIEGNEWPLEATLTIQIGNPDQPDYETTTTLNPADQDHGLPWFKLDLTGIYNVQPGEIVTVFDATTTKQVVAVGRNIASIDPLTDIITGMADPTVKSVVLWTSCVNNDCTVRRKDVGTDGSWSVNFAIPGELDWENDIVDITADTNGGIFQGDEDGDGTSYLEWRVPHPPLFMLTVNNDSSWRGLDAWFWPLGSQVTLSVTDPNATQNPVYTEVQTMMEGNGRTHAMYMQDYDFEGHPGFIITLSDGIQTKSMIVPFVAITGYDILNDTISGIADPFAKVLVVGPCTIEECSNPAEVEVIADGNGHWSAYFADIQPGEGFEAMIYDADWDHTVVRDWSVRLDLKGFYQPVDMNGIYNVVKGGSTVPFKFEIFAGPTELTNITAFKSFAYAQMACEANASTDQIETVVTGSSGLRYDSVAGQFIYNWKTPANAGKCYRVTMTTLDGSSLVAYFKLK